LSPSLESDIFDVSELELADFSDEALSDEFGFLILLDDFLSIAEGELRVNAIKKGATKLNFLKCKSYE